MKFKDSITQYLNDLPNRWSANFLAFLAYHLTKENLSYADTKMVSQTIIKEFKTFLNWIFLIKLKYPTIHQTISKLKSLL